MVLHTTICINVRYGVYYIMAAATLSKLTIVVYAINSCFCLLHKDIINRVIRNYDGIRLLLSIDN